MIATKLSVFICLWQYCFRLAATTIKQNACSQHLYRTHFPNFLNKQLTGWVTEQFLVLFTWYYFLASTSVFFRCQGWQVCISKARSYLFCSPALCSTTAILGVTPLIAFSNQCLLVVQITVAMNFVALLDLASCIVRTQLTALRESL